MIRYSHLSHFLFLEKEINSWPVAWCGWDDHAGICAYVLEVLQDAEYGGSMVGRLDALNK